MKMSAHLMAGLIASSLAAGPAVAADRVLAIPVIDVESSDGVLTVTAVVNGVEPGTVTGIMTLERTGTSGSVTTNQSQELEVEPGGRYVVATNAISFASVDVAEISLQILQNGTVSSEARLTVNAPAR